MKERAGQVCLLVPLSSRLRTDRKIQPVRTDPDSTMAAEPTLSSLAQLAESASTRADRSTALQEAEPESQEKTKEQLRRHYVRALHKVVDESDIIVLVLDARDPEGCRSRLVEEEVRRREHEGKRLVFVMNKIGVLNSLLLLSRNEH